MSGLSPLGDLVRRHDPDRYLCALFAPAEKREALFTLLAFNHELARCREATRQPVAMLIRLQWWREVVENVAAGHPPRRHEVATPLHAMLASGTLAAEDALAMIDAREAEAEELGPANTAALQAYLRGTAGSLAVATGRLLGGSGAALASLQAAGASYGLAGALRSTRALAAQGRCLLPLDALAAARLTPEAAAAAPEAAAVRGIERVLAADGLAAAHALRPSLRGLPRPLLPAVLPFTLARRDLARLAQGRAVPWPRRLGDRLAVMLAAATGKP